MIHLAHHLVRHVGTGWYFYTVAVAYVGTAIGAGELAHRIRVRRATRRHPAIRRIS